MSCGYWFQQVFLFEYYLSIKKIVYNLLVLLLIIQVVIMFIGTNNEEIIALGHAGGLVGGVLATLLKRLHFPFLPNTR